MNEIPVDLTEKQLCPVCGQQMFIGGKREKGIELQLVCTPCKVFRRKRFDSEFFVDTNVQKKLFDGMNCLPDQQDLF